MLDGFRSSPQIVKSPLACTQQFYQDQNISIRSRMTSNVHVCVISIGSHMTSNVHVCNQYIGSHMTSSI